MSEIVIDDELLARAREVATSEGFASLEEFVASVLAERVRQPRQADFREGTRTIQEAVSAAGLTESQVLDDFERFRDELWRREAATEPR